MDKNPQTCSIRIICYSRKHCAKRPHQRHPGGRSNLLPHDPKPDCEVSPLTSLIQMATFLLNITHGSLRRGHMMQLFIYWLPCYLNLLEAHEICWRVTGLN